MSQSSLDRLRTPGLWQAVACPIVAFLLLVPFVAPAAPPQEFAPSLTHIRVGVHPTFTRVVIDLSSATEWSADADPDGCIRILIPHGRLLPSAAAIEVGRGVVRSVRPMQRPSGIEIFVACRQGGVEFRTLNLQDPDRIVVDLSAAASTPGERKAPPPMTVQSASPSPGSNRPTSKPSAEAPQKRLGSTEASSAPPSGPTPPAKDRAAARPGPPAPVPEHPLTIVLDPGHGGHDTGAVGPNGLVEKDVVLDLAVRLARLLRERLGLRVLLTRSEDVFVPLPDRTAFANRAKADFLVSLHVNGAGKRGALGFETFFFSREPSDSDARASAQRENVPLESAGPAGSAQEALLRATLADMAVTRDMKESSNLAEALLVALDGLLAVQNRGVKSGPFYVLATAAMPAVLVESAFITNPREERKLRRDAYRQRLAEALFDGISRYKARYERRLGLVPEATPGRS